MINPMIDLVLWLIGPSDIESEINPKSESILDGYLYHLTSNLDGPIPSNIESPFQFVFSRFDMRWCRLHLISDLDAGVTI